MRWIPAIYCALSLVLLTGCGRGAPVPKASALSPTQASVQHVASRPEQSATAAPSSNKSQHWAYRAPERPPLPAVQAADWPRNPIDCFVLSRLEQQGLAPAAAIDRARLLRRAAIAVTGLPPTIEDLDRFLADPRPDAYERAVDRLLASPHYGEHFARSWLDLVRYADTDGYEKDLSRSIWRYRDWVIDALNRDLPFDQFTVEQLAGDLLPQATIETRIATGMHRNTMQNREAGVDPEEARWETIVDRVNTTATIWLGTTLGCAQCHDHKYDPFTQEDYYRLFAIFNQDDEPTLDAPLPEQARKYAPHLARLDRLQSVLASDTPELIAARRAWEQRMAEHHVHWTVLAPVEMTSSGGAGLTRLEDDSILAAGRNPFNDTYRIKLRTDVGPLTGLRLEVLPDESLPHESIGRHPNGSFVLSHLKLAAASRKSPWRTRKIEFRGAATDYNQQGYRVESLIDGSSGPGWAVDAWIAEYRVPRSALFELAEPLEIEGEAELTVTLLHRSEFALANLGRFRLSVTADPAPLTWQSLPDDVAEVIATAEPDRGLNQTRRLNEYYRSIAPSLEPVRRQLAQLRAGLPKFPTTLVLRQSKMPRETHLHVGGSFTRPGPRVEAGTPDEILPDAALPSAASGNVNRLSLARWLVDNRNPLTARVTANRIWQQLWGRGLVATPDDFGTQGAPPTHPQLLDWLATELTRGDWRLKPLVRLIVTSSAFRQSSALDSEKLDRDPHNEWLARGPRFRLPAETVRDVTLAASGLLPRVVGGPSVFPPQPPGVWTMIGNKDRWENSHGADRYRRGLYTFWRRTAPHPAFAVFDAPSRETCAVNRPRSNTPLQALALLNDEASLECAARLALDLLLSDATSADRIETAFRRCVARRPSPLERTRLEQYLAGEEQYYRDHPDEAEALLTGPRSELPGVAGEFDPARWAAWTMAASVMLNLDETINQQ